MERQLSQKHLLFNIKSCLLNTEMENIAQTINTLNSRQI